MNIRGTPATRPRSGYRKRPMRYSHTPNQSHSADVSPIAIYLTITDVSQKVAKMAFPVTGAQATWLSIETEHQRRTGSGLAVARI
jgi:hypothetical protein